MNLLGKRDSNSWSHAPEACMLPTTPLPNIMCSRWDSNPQNSTFEIDTSSSCVTRAFLRRRPDSNGRHLLQYGGFQDRWFKPLTHTSKKKRFNFLLPRKVESLYEHY